MNILITGGAGYIGSVLAHGFLNDGHHVKIVDSLMYDQGPLVSSVLLRSNCEFFRNDIRNLPSKALNVDIVYHLAALVTIPGCENHLDAVRDVNATAIDTLVKQLSPSQRLIFCCTNSGYGYSDSICTEETPFKPNSVYGKTKAEGEQIILQHPNSTSLRLATVYGPSFRPRLDLIVNNFVYQMLYDYKLDVFNPHHRRNFVCIDDVVNILEQIVPIETSTQQVYNVGCDKDNITKLRLAELIKEQLGGTIMISDSGDDIDKRDYLVDNSKLKTIGLEAKLTIKDTLPRLVDWFKLMPHLSSDRREYTTIINNDYIQDWL